MTAAAGDGGHGEAEGIRSGVADNGAESAIALAEALAETTARAERLARHLAYLMERSTVEALFFDRQGAPGILLRRLVFRRDGGVRRPWRRLVFGSDGAPRRAWQRWIESPAYCALPKAARMRAGLALDPTPAPSPRTAHFRRLLAGTAGSGRPAL